MVHFGFREIALPSRVLHGEAGALRRRFKEGMERIAITMGDAAGIGPEIVVKTLSREDVRSRNRVLVLGRMQSLEDAMRRCAVELPLRTVTDAAAWDPEDPIPAVWDLSTGIGDIPLGAIDARAGELAVRCIRKAAELAMAGTVDGMVTCPINKEAVARAGLPFPGHTEFLAHLTGAEKVVMMLMGSRLRVTLVTIHVPLAEVSPQLSVEAVFDTIKITHEGLQKDFGIRSPRLAVAGFNPHAGESGLFGNEERSVIIPAVEGACNEGIDCSGPYPPDTVFYKAAEGQFDAVVCMYHDQGLIPLKLLHFRDGVNVTLGLPIVRVSVDHGTAFDIAGQGIADPASLINAIATAGLMARNRRASLSGLSSEKA